MWEQRQAAWMVLLKYFKFKTTGKQPLPDPNGELNEKILSLGISSANVFVGKLLDSTSDDDNKQNSRTHTKFNTGSEIFVIVMNHCLHTKQVLHAGLHYTLHVIQNVMSQWQIISWVTSECFVISTRFWAVVKILFVNLCCELFRQKFLPPKFCIIR